MAAVAAAKPVIKVAALCGSLRKGSYNRGLLRTGSVSAKSVKSELFQFGIFVFYLVSGNIGLFLFFSFGDK